MMLPFAERSASGHPPCGWGVSGALINEGALTWGSDLSGSLEGDGGVGGLLMMEEKPGSTTGVPVGTYYPLYDGNGNITQLLDSAGGVAAHYDYDAFGNVTAATGPAAANNPWRFSTKALDPVSKLCYYGYRHYDPVTGRWPSRDPIGESGGYNLFSFVGNSSPASVDILGLQTEFSMEEYIKLVRQRLQKNPKQSKWHEAQLVRGCVGLTTHRLGDYENHYNCYQTKELAERRKSEMNKKNPACCAEICSIHLANDVGKDKSKRDVTFDRAGKADLSNWDRSSSGVNFDYGYLNF